MSLPSGLLFYLDYTYGTAQGDAYDAGESLYNNPVGKGVQSGSLGSGGQYDLAGSGYSKRHATASAVDGNSDFLPDVAANQMEVSLSATGGGAADAAHSLQVTLHGGFGTGTSIAANTDLNTSGRDGRLILFDAELSKRIVEDSEGWACVFVPLRASIANLDTTMVKSLSLTGTNALLTAPTDMQSGGAFNLRRLNEIGTVSATGVFTANAFAPRGSAASATADTDLVLKAIVQKATAGDAAAAVPTTAGASGMELTHVVAAGLDVNADQGDTLVIPGFEGDGSNTGAAIPEIDIKIEALAVTAQSRKLKAKWSPELAQDLNAYHSLDAEVELTQILSEQIALEIDREILNDLLLQGNGANLFWSRSPGKFVNKETGTEVAQTSSLTPGPAFTGTVREWYETLTETVIDAANTIHRKTLRGSANFIVVGPDVATILESSVMYRPSYSLDGEGQVGSPMTIGADKVGTLSNRFTVYKDPYFPRNKILVGYKGGSYLETGYVYAPYVPLIVTPTIFQPEDFTPRKGVMTRYGKKMVRSDFYGTVTVLDMNVI